jgi:hypothetical protein
VHEVAQQVVARLVDRRVPHLPGAEHRERVAVGRRARRQLERDRAACAGAIVDDDALAEPIRQLGRDDAGDHIETAARRVRHEQPDRLRRIRLRERRPGRGQDQRKRHCAHDET